jgi:hypothetical protein
MVGQLLLYFCKVPITDIDIPRDTDWIFVKRDKLDEAAEALTADGWVVL